MESRWSSTKSIKWDEADILGRGCEGTVVFAGHFNDEPVAVKRILLTNVQLVERELKALFHCRHPRILQLLHVEQEHPFLRLALELCVATLDDYCKGNYTGPMPEEMEAPKQMLEGLAFIHSRNYVHRDVKPNNILISSSGGLKIADFGFCKLVRSTEAFSMSAAGIGTAGWMAPELLKNMQDLENGRNAALHATTAIDVFSLGCVFFFFFTKGTHPFGIAMMRNANILMGKYNLTKLEKKHVFLRGLIKEMISMNPEDRPKLDEILKRPVFNAPNVSDSNELLKDDKKFDLWLRNIKNKFASTKKKSGKIRPTQSNTTNDECDSVARPTTLFAATNNRTLIFQGQTGLQVVNEEPSPTSSDGLKMSTRRRAQTSSDTIKQRLQVSSAPTSWQRTLPRSRPGRFIWSEFFADGTEEELYSSFIPRVRSVASLSNLEPGLTSSAESFSDLSITSSSLHSKTDSQLSLSRSCAGDPLNKSK
ncbi:serine/threonine-protein kinase/endoribonuclease IRE1-like [Daphnia carinata]|uniref:serine/threonine-protein kinase/endoribonuclease IRE1-like n=1 Tax=Daphnia carinata TaxID=120202 RepID=UPI00257C0BFC|nr:serine/threonine-protein kinase/endoribonuclease IRE1-like [Daphnia carinata]XP_059352807.1 serine/threonine-protein kinase/endoribonuclease IRE1-like [Daphnia carinata]